MGTLWFFRYFEYFVITPDAQGCKSGISWIIVRDHLFVENKQKNIIWTLVQGISGWLLDYLSKFAWWLIITSEFCLFDQMHQITAWKKDRANNCSICTPRNVERHIYDSGIIASARGFWNSLPFSWQMQKFPDQLNKRFQKLVLIRNSTEPLPHSHSLHPLIYAFSKSCAV